MKIEVYTSSADHPIYAHLLRWAEENSTRNEVRVTLDRDAIGTGDLLLLIAATQMIGRKIRSRFRWTLVVHPSALPKGRGWSPQAWQILEGRSDIPLTLFEAEDSVDSGAIWARGIAHYDGHELYDEINQRLFVEILRLMQFAADHAGTVEPEPQQGDPTFYRRRTPEDSRIDPAGTIADQFDLLRIADPNRFPAFFDHRGKRYTIQLRKAEGVGVQGVGESRGKPK